VKAQFRGLTDERRWNRWAKTHLASLFARIPGKPG
jgi:hypothetical protein